nr:glycosyltransferase family 2 protein [Candidatus Levybacteria bacterium]
MKQKSPFFTISIPSLNRIESLKLVINSILNQTFSDYEILIIDDHSDDNIKGYINSLRSSKIRLIENKKRKGFKTIYKECLLISNGVYVLTLGNDDILCNKNSLRNIYTKLKSKKVGLAKIGLIYYYKSPSNPCFSTRLDAKDIFINSRQHKKIIEAIDSYGITHIAGTIYLRELINQESFTDSELMPFLKTIVGCAMKKGFLFISGEYVAVGVSTSYLSLFSKRVNYKHTWFYLMYSEYKLYLNENEVKKMLVKKMTAQIPFLIAIKSYVGFREVLDIIFSYIRFNLLFIFNPMIYIFALLSLLTPSKLFFMYKERHYNKMIKAYVPVSKYKF